MGRRPRATSATTIHHVMNRGVDRAPIFFDDVDRVGFLHGVQDCNEQFEFHVLAYCLMGNHYHLVVRSPTSELSAAMHHLGTRFVRRTNDRVGRDGPLFRGRFVSLPVESDDYLANLVRYVHRNPLDIRGIMHPADYRWSSYRAFLGHRRVPEFLDTAPALDRFDGQLTRLARFTEDAGTDAAAILDPSTLRAVIAREIAVASTRLPPDRRPPRAQLVLEALLQLIDPDVARRHAVLLPHRSAEADAVAKRRARRRFDDDAVLREIVERVVGGADAQGRAA